MKTETENLDTQDSLKIITSMIQQAQGNMQKNSFYFLLWGWVIALANLGMYGLMKFTDYPHPYIVWSITILAWIVSLYHGYRQRSEARVTTHFDRIAMWSWLSFGITAFIIVFFGWKINYNINPVLLTVSAIPTLIAGVILKFRPLILGAICFWIMAILCFIADSELQYLIGALAVVLGYLVPGYILRMKTD
jgi:hypothetical protein